MFSRAETSYLIVSSVRLISMFCGLNPPKRSHNSSIVRASVLRTSPSKSAFRPGSIADGIASVTSSASFFIFRTFIRSILPKVIVIIFTKVATLRSSISHYCSSMNFSRISLDVETISHLTGVAISGHHTLMALTLRLSSIDVFRDSR